MHDAFKVSVALDKLQHKIESIFAYGQKLFIGTNTGVLLTYEVNEPSDDEPITVTLIETHKNFSKKPIEQLDIIKEIGVLISLSDGCVNKFDLSTLKFQEQLPKTRGANLFAIDTHVEIDENKIPMLVTRLAVAVKKKLLVLTWKDSESQDTKELLPPDKVRTMAWVSSSKICLGLANEYALMDVNTGALTELFAPSSTPSSTSFSYMGMIGSKVSKPMVTKLPNDEILLAKDNVSIFVGLDGNPTRKAGIDWTGTPEEIGYSYPYLIAILPKHVEVRNIMTQSLVQTVELPQARIINQGKYLYVASYSCVWRFTPLGFEKQIDQLIGKFQFEEAISLAEQIEPILLDDKDAKILEIRRLYAHHLFQQQKFDDAITIFQDLETEPAEVVALYPTSISGDLHVDANHHHVVNKNSDINNVVEEHENGYSATDSSATDSASEADVGLKQNENDVKEIEAEKKIFLEGKLLEDAVSALIRFLTDRRQKISKILKSSNHINGNFNKLLEYAELVDTTLLKSYMVINESLVGPLLRVPNHCNVEESEGLLFDRKKYRELVDLYKGKGLHRKSLDLLKKLGQSNEGPMTGTIHTILYLQKLGMDYIDLILEYATWVLETNPEDGMDIFIEDYLEVENLPRDKVLKYLEGFSYDLCIIYLEHIIYQLGDQTSDYHNLLITTYLNKVQQLTSQDQQSHSELIDATNKKLLKFLDESTHYKAEKILGQLPLDDFYEARAILLSRLKQHDQALNIYVHKLQNEKMAEDYCVKYHKESDDSSKNVFLSLLRVYLSPANGEEIMIEPALRLLSRHGSHVNASEVLNILPSSTKVTQLYSFFEKYIRESNRNRNMSMIVKNLLKANQHQAEEQLMFYRSRRVKIDEDRMCPQCTRRIGHSGVFAVFPNGIVVHYHCKEKYSQAHDTAI
ncbi:hypothetical protein Glove_101g19 [Diversispora epigaea]|uniref:CNH domain-containing protein n=1 Tax=Diversispora epigaea TaxID=1348612 RepID=A0A397JCR5_9GLOM|nr:hypothetical protein Glove_101g19 [Diversispora epigaea]